MSTRTARWANSPTVPSSASPLTIGTGHPSSTTFRCVRLVASFLLAAVCVDEPHTIQAQKFAGTPHEEAIRKAKTVKAAHNMGNHDRCRSYILLTMGIPCTLWFMPGRDRSKPLRADWEQVKERVAEEAIRAKFQQNEEARKKLLATGNARLIQRTRNDAFWGVPGSGSAGENRMGTILTKVREELRQDAAREQG